MMIETESNHTDGPATQPDPQQDRDAQPMPERIAHLLCILSIIAAHGRRLAEMFEHRAFRGGFSTIAQFFGTARISTILAHVYRGIMRAVALERMLLERARSGRDLVVPAQRDRATRPADPPTPPAAATPAAASPRQTAARRPCRRTGSQEELTLDNLPSMRQVEAEVRDRPIGRTLVGICLDFGIAPFLCAAPFGTELFSLFRRYGGSFNKYFSEIRRCEKRFGAVELDHKPELGRPVQTRDELRQILDVFLGEHWLADPFSASPAPDMAVAAAATGPP